MPGELEFGRMLGQRAEDLFRCARRGVRLAQMGANQVNQQPFLYDMLNRQFGLVNTDGDAGSGDRYLVDTAAVLKRRRRRRRAQPAQAEQVSKQAMQIDGLGKNTSPAMAGNGLAAPMPQTNYAKGTLENEFAQRLGKQQYDALRKATQQPKQNSTNSNASTDSTTTTSNGTTTTTTTSVSGMTGSGLISSLSLSGAV